MKVPFSWKPTGWFMIGWSAEFPAGEVRQSMEDELGIWRYQEYVEHPALAKEDARPYRPLRKWAKQFDETEAREDVTTHGERRAMRS